jgi:uncharacterized protein (DUF2252 family)
VSDDVSRITALAVTPRAELRERGRAERLEVRRRDHCDWVAPVDRRSPIRYGRMAANAFAFFRDAPAVMAADLARTPTTRIRPQICGDAHLSNFGVFGTPERSMIFDLNDFDETLPGPFEWDLKRLTARVVIAARAHGFGNRVGRDAARGVVRAYATRIEGPGRDAHVGDLVLEDRASRRPQLDEGGAAAPPAREGLREGAPT